MKHLFWVYLAIIGISIVLAVNPLTYGLIESADWWRKWIWRGYLLAIDTYLMLLATASICHVAGRGRRYRNITLGLLICFLPFLFTVELGLNRYKFDVVQGELRDTPELEDVVPDELVGWRPKEAAVVGIKRPDGSEVMYRIDADGAREIGAKQSASKSLFFFGDSMLFGPFVDNEETALSVLSERLGPHYQVTNYAVSGYGLQQMLGRLIQKRDRIALGDAVLFAPYSADLERNLVFKRLPCGQHFTARAKGRSDLVYPVLERGEIKAIQLEKACNLYQDYLLLRSFLPLGSLYRSSRRAFLMDRMMRMADKVFVTARQIAEGRGASFHVIFVAAPHECIKRRTSYDLTGLKTAHRTIIDQCPTKAESAMRLRFPYDYHYSVEGNRWAAAALESVLRTLAVVKPDSKHSAN